MSTYVIGDVHGCFDELIKLLDLINFDSKNDKLLFTGDLVNGGPKSIDTLEFVKSLGDNAISVLGNHDLTLLALDKSNLSNLHIKDSTKSFTEILNYNKKNSLLDWLINLPLAYFEKDFNCLIIHAGLYPLWSLNEVLQYAKEVQEILRSTSASELLSSMYGNAPDKWNNDLSGWDRFRFIINACTRMRFCTENGKLDFEHKGTIEKAPIGYKPWFEIKNKKFNSNIRVIFGHWSALLGKTTSSQAVALDTGCIWGNLLTALRLDDNKRYQVSCQKYCSF